MEIKETLFEPLLEKAEQYGKTSIELLKLKSIDKAADVTSTLTSRLLLVIVFSLFALTSTIALSLWLGDLLGKNYYGFLVVAAFYGLAAVVLFYIHPLIKTRVNNMIITQLLN